jgi:hypothetical protein
VTEGKEIALEARYQTLNFAGQPLRATKLSKANFILISFSPVMLGG